MYIGLTCIYVFSHIVRWRMVVSLSAVIGCNDVDIMYTFVHWYGGIIVKICL